MTKKDLAARLNISVPTIERLMVKGLPHIKIERSVRFEEAEVMEWIKETYNKGA